MGELQVDSCDVYNLLWSGSSNQQNIVNREAQVKCGKMSPSPRITRTALKKNEVGRLTHPDFKTYNKGTVVIKTHCIVLGEINHRTCMHAYKSYDLYVCPFARTISCCCFFNFFID